MARKLNLVGISMIRNDADIVEAFVRHCCRLLDHLFVIVHSPEDGTGEILKALHAEGLPMTLVLDDEPAFLQGERLTWLARQAQAALEGARLHRVRLEKERQDRDLQIARGIQQSLFPRGFPEVPGFDVLAESRSCFEVGGDYYDFIPLDGGRLALVVADVSGKGTPASLMMASIHAWLQAMAGTARPRQVLERLDRFLNANTQTSRYVTLFYGELDPARRRLVYVNAGHVPPSPRRRYGGT